MGQDDADELRRKLEQARRLASMTSDLTTTQRLREFADELSARLKNYFASRRQREEIRGRAQELREHNGRPGGGATWNSGCGPNGKSRMAMRNPRQFSVLSAPGTRYGT
ncbi:MAG: hypothetical protein QOD09_2163 [Bradyrhizobium sp.]|jgi:hypothetical protein|nr:hypothetical protein [Bradyrhizobium sp.]MEA2951789.1 hypothetical protein [Alphaproteobacteria bacterium]